MNTSATISETLSLGDDWERLVRREQLGLLVRQTPCLGVANIATALLLSVVVGADVPVGILVSWVGLVVLAGLYMLANWWRHKREAKPGSGSPRAFRKATVFAAAFGIVWAMAAPMFTPYLNYENQIFLYIVLSGIVAGGAVNLASVPRATFAFIVPIIAVIFAFIIFRGELAHMALGVMLALFFVTIAVATKERPSAATAVAAARFARERLAETLDMMSEAFCIFDANDRLVLFNSRYRDTFPEIADQITLGRTFEDIVRSSVDKGLIASALGRPDEYVRERLEQHRSPIGSYIFERTDGRWLESKERRLPDEGTVGIHRDITERKLGEDALRWSENRYRALFEGAPIPIREEDFSNVKNRIDNLNIESNEEFSVYLDENPEFVKECADLMIEVDANIAALNLHQSPNKPEFLAAFTKDFRECDLKGLQYVLVAMHRGETRLEFASTVARPDGTERNVIAHWSVAAGHEETYSRVLFISVDVTEHKRAVEALGVREAYTRGIMTNIADAVVTIDARGEIQSFNPAAEVMFGLDAAEVIGENVSILMPEPHHSKHDGYINAYLETGRGDGAAQGWKYFPYGTFRVRDEARRRAHVHRRHARHYRTQGDRSTAPASPKDGSRGPVDRRCGARLQQSAHRHPRESRYVARPRCEQPGCPRACRHRHQSFGARRRPDPTIARLLAQASSRSRSHGDQPAHLQLDRAVAADAR
jgi:PAS domain S-box-containing protein